MKYIREISATTEFAAVIGQPIHHSKSPAIYNTCFEVEDINMVYLAFETSEEETVERIHNLQNLGVKGINITMPGKYKALECVTKVDAVANYVQAINTIVKQDDEWIGYNTDGEGFWASVKSTGTEIEDTRVALFGSGSTARVILSRAVIEGCRQIDVIARNLERPLEIKEVIKKLQSDYPSINIRLVNIEEEDILKEALSSAEIVVQTTSVGMTPNPDRSILLNPDWLNPNSVVCDIVYEPRETLFLRQAKARGCKTVGGLSMLVYQASLNYRLFTGNDMPVEYVLSVLENK
ncbi:shikimate dehydrogenase [Jeotgalibaca ciconiae]|nr:shikimate dehydrogenase [Jeotgalibaca ciconiae]HJB23608.1 shikimate dehydrogenase [Candidatus Jeotgalibaca pullicola]